MSEKKLDVEAIINTLASMRERIPQLAKARAAAPPPEVSEERLSFVPGDEEAMRTFEMQALADALESFANELRTSIEEAQEKLIADALNVYYTAEELIKDPAHADLIPHVEQMRAAYKRDFGKDIPPKK
jgi:hypothetical protein